MVKMSKMVEYSILILTRLAKLKTGEIISARRMSDEYKLPLPTVSKILKTLAKCGVVKSVQGAKGGYRLDRDTSNINLRELIDIFDGNAEVISCAGDEDNQSCEYSGECPVKNTMLILNREINKTFENLTLEKLVLNSNNKYNL